MFEFPTGRIIDGFPLNITEVPWQVSLDTNNQRPFCGGSIISSRWILTAAHCLWGTPNIRVRVGATDISTDGETIGAELIIRHPISEEAFDYDFGLIKLRKAIKFNNKMMPINLPDFTDENAAAGTECLVSGWGLTKQNGKPSDILLGVKVPIVDQNDCKKVYDSITPQMICAGYEEGGRNSRCI